jgi:hypothetical protein
LIAVEFGISPVLESEPGPNFSGLVYWELRDGTGPSRIGFSAVRRANNENPASKTSLSYLPNAIPSVRWPVRRPSRSCKSMVSRHESRQHGSDQRCWIMGRLAAIAREDFNVSKQIAMHGCRKFDRQLHQFIVHNGAELELRHVFLPSLCMVQSPGHD